MSHTKLIVLVFEEATTKEVVIKNIEASSDEKYAFRVDAFDFNKGIIYDLDIKDNTQTPYNYNDENYQYQMLFSKEPFEFLVLESRNSYADTATALNMRDAIFGKYKSIYQTLLGMDNVLAVGIILDPYLGEPDYEPELLCRQAKNGDFKTRDDVWVERYKP